MKKFFEEFKKFAMRGNVVDMAVGVVVGGAFNKNNTKTLDIYKHLGFEIVREEVTDIGEGYVMDDYVLEYRI